MSESSAWSSLPGLEQLQSLAGAYLLVACAEAAAAAAQDFEGAAAGLEGLGLQQQVSGWSTPRGHHAVCLCVQQTLFCCMQNHLADNVVYLSIMQVITKETIIHCSLL